MSCSSWVTIAHAYIATVATIGTIGTVTASVLSYKAGQRNGRKQG